MTVRDLINKMEQNDYIIQYNSNLDEGLLRASTIRAKPWPELGHWSDLPSTQTLLVRNCVIWSPV